MQLTFDILQRVALRPPNKANAQSFLTALDKYGPRFGLDQPHRLAQFLPQLLHESADFRYDEEIWGPTPAQKRYDTRTDLGNTPEADGDGKLYRGRAGIQITGKANYAAFTKWCRKNIDENAPNFVTKPHLINTDPWEGLVPIWYWEVKGLNRYADEGNPEMITKRINGGLNGYADRLNRLTRVSLVFLGYEPDAVGLFQLEAGLELVDNDAGPQTRAALHKALVRLTAGAMERPSVKIAPVTEEKAVAVSVPELSKPVSQTSGFWERIGSIATAGSGLGALLFGDWRVTAVALGGIAVIAIIGLVFHSRIVAAVRAIKAGVEA